MTEIVLCNTPQNPESLNSQCGINADEIMSLSHHNSPVINSYTPYLVGQNPTAVDKNILSCLSPMPVSRELTNMSLSLGADNTIALAEITAKLRDYNIGLMGASTSVYANRINGFGKAVKEYQDALMDYRKAIKTNAAVKLVAKQKVEKAFQKMQIGFRQELAAVTAQSRARRGVPLTNVTRATNIARSSRTATKLNVTSQVQANNLVKFSQHAKVLGNGLAVIDFGSRIGNITNTYKSDGNWEREMFIESSSFATSAVAGTLAVNVGLAILMVVTPVGWVGLIIGGLAIAGTAAAVSMGMNHVVKENAGDVYDGIMDWMNP